MKIALAQINTTVGDLAGNVDRMIRCPRRRPGARPPGRLSRALRHRLSAARPGRKANLRRALRTAVERLAAETAGLDLALICGYVARAESPTGKHAANNAAVIRRGQVLFRQTKMLLPTYDVFDEARYFVPAESQSVFQLDGMPVALTICEDAWNDKQFWERPLYRRDPVEELAQRRRGRCSSASTLRPITWASAPSAARSSPRPRGITTCPWST